MNGDIYFRGFSFWHNSHSESSWTSRRVSIWWHVKDFLDLAMNSNSVSCVWMKFHLPPLLPNKSSLYLFFSKTNRACVDGKTQRKDRSPIKAPPGSGGRVCSLKIVHPLLPTSSTLFILFHLVTRNLPTTFYMPFKHRSKPISHGKVDSPSQTTCINECLFKVYQRWLHFSRTSFLSFILRILIHFSWFYVQ